MVQVDPREWRDGNAIAASIATRVPAGVIVRINAPGPDRSSGSARPAPAAKARWRLSRVFRNESFLLILACCVLVGAIVLGVATHVPMNDVFPGPVLLLFILFRLLARSGSRKR